MANHLPHLGTKGPLVYGALARQAAVRELLVTHLLALLAQLDPKWAGASERGPVVLAREPWGRPLIFLGDDPGPAVSFSEAGDLVWGAVSARGKVGLDLALATDFAPPYPYARVFGPKEWGWALTYCQGRPSWAGALLWAAKEAAAKALGLGFHRWPPVAFGVDPPLRETEGLFLTVRVQNTPIAAWASPLEEGWLALAVV